MSKISALLRFPQFWITFLVSAALLLAIETFFLSLWALPIIGYRIPYMGAIGPWDLFFVGAFALVFGVGISLLQIMKCHGAGTCAVGAVGGLTTLFTLLCPICPVFFLTYFGLSASVAAFAPFFWPLRIVALVLVLSGTVLLWRRFNPAALPRSQMNGETVVQGAFLTIVLLLLISNQTFARQAGEALMGPQAGAPIELSGNFANDIAALVTPTALPFYGPELGLDFSSIEKINTSINKLALMAPKQGKNPIALNEEEMKRYIAIGTEPTITCEFCCGVKTLVRQDGSPTCGCAHSIAMRGTAAYLIRNHPELSNEKISYEIARQKGLYFPVQMQQRMATQLAGNPADFTPDIRYLAMDLSSSDLKRLQTVALESGFEPTAAPNMVGGC